MNGNTKDAENTGSHGLPVKNRILHQDFFSHDLIDELPDEFPDEDTIDEIISETDSYYDKSDEPLDNLEEPIHSENLLAPEGYEGESARFMENVARDETIDDILFFIKNHSKLSPQAQARLSVFAACFQSKNTVYSVFTDRNDFLQAIDDLKYVEKISQFGLRRRDRNVAWEMSKGLIESQAYLRLRQSKGGLARKQLNTTVSESVHENRETKREEQKQLARKIPLIGRFF
jgi:hypothetical protein